jgi:hypothetical protein
MGTPIERCFNLIYELEPSTLLVVWVLAACFRALSNAFSITYDDFETQDSKRITNLLTADGESKVPIEPSAMFQQPTQFLAPIPAECKLRRVVRNNDWPCTGGDSLDGARNMWRHHPHPGDLLVLKEPVNGLELRFASHSLRKAPIWLFRHSLCNPH